MNVIDRWLAHWGSTPKTEVLFDPGPRRWVTAAELEERSAQAAGGLVALGVGSGQVVVWFATADLDAVAVLIGALRLGAVVVPVNPALTGRELGVIADDLDPSLWCGSEPGPLETVGLWRRCVTAAELLASPPWRPPTRTARDALALIMYTSGTTGAPKGAEISYGNIEAGIDALAAAWEWSGEDTLIHALPLFHVHGLCVALFGSLTVGGRAVLTGPFRPEVAAGAMDEQRASLFFGVPTMYQRLLEVGQASQLRSLRLAVSGSAPLSKSTFEAVEIQSGQRLLERYGMTETQLTLSNPLRGERRPGTVGRPLPGVEIRTRPIGDGEELLVRGPGVFGGYRHRPEASKECFDDGWFCTGDLVSIGSDGYVTITGRRSELIISGGENVSPAEVEAVLAQCPGVAEVAVAGRPSQRWGEEVTAFVVVDGSLDDADLMAFAAQRLAPAKRPRAIVRLDALPRNALGKVTRRELG